MMRLRQGSVLKAAVAGVDALAMCAALYGAYGIRFDFALMPVYWQQLVRLLPIVLLIRLSALYWARGYQFLWRYAGLTDLLRVMQASVTGLVMLAVVNYFRNYPLGVLIGGAFFASALVHRGYVHLRPRVQHRRVLLRSSLVASVLLLGLGFVVYSVVRSAPKNVVDLPFGVYLAPFDFPLDLAMPRGALVMESVLSFVFLCGVRITPRIFGELWARGGGQQRRTLVFGAGDSGESIVRALKKDPSLGHVPVGFVDDDPAKQRISIHGVRVLGGRDELAGLIEEYRINELMIAVSALSDQDLREIAAICWQKRVTVRRVPSLASMVDPAVGLRNLESVDVEELLGRPEIELDPERVRAYLRDRVVLVTGAGGSIGSELCRQISRCHPARLLLLGKGENSIYLIQGELAQRYPDVQVTSLIGDIGAPGKMDHVFATYHPQVVFHAAAYKHVPFMEDSPEESVLNNIMGTRNVAETALRHGCDRFVMISSDKAVSPTSMMGVTKRVAEMVLQGLAAAPTPKSRSGPRSAPPGVSASASRPLGPPASAGNGRTRFITVRFGNVLRSRGSVIPLFEKQIAAGGPVTVTHPEMKRYFMSIPEAVRLVLHSGAIARNGDLCILDMGQQVRIVDLAENMIRMTGKVPYKDIDIEFTGIRPGEKLYEELFTEEEARTLHKVEKIFVSRPDGSGCDILQEQLPALRAAALACRREEIVALLQRIVPAYTPTPGTAGPAAPSAGAARATESAGGGPAMEEGGSRVPGAGGAVADVISEPH